MIIHSRQRRRGRGFINEIINKLPIELHLPGYQYCGPGTKLAKRLARGDPGINPLDVACKEHDIAYSKDRESGEVRNTADRVLANKAWKRVLAGDASIGERASALAVTSAMKLKSKFGMGLRNKKKKKNKRQRKRKNKRNVTALKKVIKAAVTAASKTMPSKSAKSVIRSALHRARTFVKEAGGKGHIAVPRILPVSTKVGGALPFLIPLFAGLSAAGALAGGAAGITKAVNNAKAAKQELEESKRHNKTMEAIALGKGLYLKPHKKGFGIYLKPCQGKGLKKKKKLQK